MSLSPRKTGSIVLVLVLIHLFAPAVHALPPSDRIGSESFLPNVLGWLMALVSSGEPELQRIREKVESRMDPSGPMQSSAGLGSKAGSSMDPDGDK